MKNFLFERPETTEAQQKNWENLIQNTTIREFDPFFGTTPAAAGFTGVTPNTSWGMYSTFGPIVHFTITVIGSPLSWNFGSTLLLPVTAASRTSPTFTGLVNAGTNYPGTGDYTVTGDPLSWWALLATPTHLYSTFPNAATTVPTSLNIQGWYFRD